MRSTKTVSITLPPEMLARAEELAKREHRTMSELIREALRHYERSRWWESMNEYGSALARERQLTPADVVAAVKEVRKTRRSRTA